MAALDLGRALASENLEPERFACIRLAPNLLSGIGMLRIDMDLSNYAV